LRAVGGDELKLGKFCSYRPHPGPLPGQGEGNEIDTGERREIDRGEKIELGIHSRQAGIFFDTLSLYSKGEDRVRFFSARLYPTNRLTPKGQHPHPALSHTNNGRGYYQHLEYLQYSEYLQYFEYSDYSGWLSIN
jgi:hypothetical protein